MSSPFSEYKATELTEERIKEYFVEPRYIAKMFTNDVAFIVGQRGTGKTTMLKHLCSKYNEDSFVPKERLGIYYRFDINKMHSFSGSVLNDEQWSQLFAHCFSTEICLELTKVVRKLRNRPLSNESEICRKVRSYFYDDYEGDVRNFEELQSFLELVELCAKKYKRNPLRASVPIFSECEKAFEEYCKLIASEECSRSICTHFLFDEYENMLDYQKWFINSCVKNAGYHHTFKICVRPGGNDDMRTLSNSEILRQTDDFKTLNYITDILGDNSDIYDFMRNACARRLGRYYEGKSIPYTDEDLKIESYFSPAMDDESRFNKILSRQKYMDRVKSNVTALFEKYGIRYNNNWTLLQMRLFLVLSLKRNFDFKSTMDAFNDNNNQYQNWLNNYKRAVLWLCFSENNIKYVMASFGDIVSIAGNVVRYVFEICDYCFLGVDRRENQMYNKVSERVQTEAIYEISKRRFEQISTIPVYGQELKQMVLVIGKIFAMFHRDMRLQRFEPNHFSVEMRSKSNDESIREQVMAAIKLGIMYGVFESERATKSRSLADVPIEDEDFFLHPIITPFFQISWRRKQKCRFTLDEINLYLFGADEVISKRLKEYAEKTSTDTELDEYTDEQLSLSQLTGFCF